MREKGLKCINAFVDPEKDDPELDDLFRTADVISMLEVLEHFEEPDKMINFLKRKMKPGALFVVEVPRHPSVASFANLTHRNIVFRHIVVPQHLQIFNEKTFEILFGNDFKVVGEWGFGQGFSDLINFPVMESGMNDEKLYAEIMSHNNEVQRIFDKSGLADSMLLVAKKI